MPSSGLHAGTGGAMAKCELCRGTSWRPIVLKSGLDGVTRCDCWVGGSPTKRLTAAGVSEEEITKALSPIDRDVAETTEALLQFVDRGMPESLLIVGRPGRGKTVLALRLMLRVIEKLPTYTLGYTFAPRLFLEIKSTYSKDSTTSELDVLDPLLRPDVLLIDDMGAEYVTEWAVSLMALLIGERYREDKRTIITSNLDMRNDGIEPSIESLYKERVASRLTSYRLIPLDHEIDLRERYRLGGRKEKWYERE